MNGFVETDTRNGRLRGVSFRGTESYLGIPYGASTAGEGRFAPPRAPERWDGVREAMAFGDASPQIDTRTLSRNRGQDVQNLMYVKGGHPLDGMRMSEDCLNLNVWTPSSADDVRRPVMVWLHGGGFVHGSAGSALYNGDQLSALGDVVVVSVNARLGIHGFLPLDFVDESFAGASNAGMLDIVAALEWVRDNIENFGGDPTNVTVFGQSGGGGKVNTLMAMPSARGLFHKAINMSGPIIAVATPEDAEALADRALEAARLTRDTVGDLRTLSMRELLDVQANLALPLGNGFGMNETAGASGTGALGYGPVLDGVYVTAHPFAGGAVVTADAIPLLVGSTSHDTALLMVSHADYESLTDDQARSRAKIHFGDAAVERYNGYVTAYPEEAPRLRYARLVSDNTFRGAAFVMAQHKSRQSAPVFAYEFAHVTDIHDTLIGCAHSLDLPFVFYTVDRSPFAGQLATRHETSRTMALAWATFARTGNPNHADIPEWAPFTEENRNVMKIDAVWTSFVQDLL